MFQRMASSVLYWLVSGLPQWDSHVFGPFSGPPSSGNLNTISCPALPRRLLELCRGEEFLIGLKLLINWTLFCTIPSPWYVGCRANLVQKKLMTSNLSPITNALYSNLTSHFIAIMNSCLARAGWEKFLFLQVFFMVDLIYLYKLLKWSIIQNGSFILTLKLVA